MNAGSLMCLQHHYLQNKTQKNCSAEFISTIDVIYVASLISLPTADVQNVVFTQSHFMKTKLRVVLF